MTPEGRVKGWVKRALATLGPDCWEFMPVQSGMGKPGLDFHLTVRGMSVYIETKPPGGALRPLQMKTRDDMLMAGALVLIVWDVPSLDNAMEIIRGIRRTPGNYGCYLTAEAGRRYQEHLRALQSGKTPKPPAGGDHGAPRKAPRRRSKSGAGGQDQTAAPDQVAAAQRRMLENGDGGFQ